VTRTQPPAIGVLARANEPALLILTSLAGGAKHGYALSKDIEDFAKVRLGPGTLYGAISRLEELGLIAAIPSEDRRQPFEITAAGSAQLSGALASMRGLLDEADRRLGSRAMARPRRTAPRIAGAN
jgi:DNA-binding PadR family transcriptional regulator